MKYAVGIIAKIIYTRPVGKCFRVFTLWDHSHICKVCYNDVTLNNTCTEVYG